MEKFSDADVLTNPLVNIHGRGKNNENLIALNPWRVDQIKTTVLRFFEGDSNIKDKVWKSYVHAMLWISECLNWRTKKESF